MREAFAKSRAFPAWNDAVGLHIKPIKRTAHDVARVAAYMCDPVHQLKLRYPDRRRPGRRKMKGTYSRRPPAIILRGTELQSHIGVYDAVFGVGPMGKVLRDAWRSRVHAALPLEEHGPNAAIDDALEEIWARINAAQPEHGFAPPEILTRSRAYAASKIRARQR